MVVKLQRPQVNRNSHIETFHVHLFTANILYIPKSDASTWNCIVPKQDLYVLCRNQTAMNSQSALDLEQVVHGSEEFVK